MAYLKKLPRKQKQRKCLLYQVWIQMVSRTRGKSTRAPWSFEGVPLGFRNYDEFRTWALANGFSKATPSPDRKKAKLGYTPGNIRFVSKNANWRLGQLQRGQLNLDDEDEIPF